LFDDSKNEISDEREKGQTKNVQPKSDKNRHMAEARRANRRERYKKLKFLYLGEFD